MKFEKLLRIPFFRTPQAAASESFCEPWPNGLGALCPSGLDNYTVCKSSQFKHTRQEFAIHKNLEHDTLFCAFQIMKFINH